MKKVFSLLVTLAIVISTAVVPMSVSADASVWDGTALDYEWVGEGTEASPYLITSAAELAGLAKTIFDAVSTTESTEKMPITKGLRRQNDMYFAYTGKYFELTTDIDLDNKEWLPIGRMYMRFDGIFNGDGHVVKNVKITTEYSAVGLFGGIGRNSRITDLGVDGVDIATTVGSAVDYVADGDVTLSVNRVRAYGGLVATITPQGDSVAILDGCFVKNVKIEATTQNMNHGCMGGLFGTAEYMTASATNGVKDQDPANTSNKFCVKNCYAMNVNLKGYSSVGAFYGGNYGFFGYDYRTTPIITNCYVAGDINIAYNSGEQAGFGFNFGSLHNAGSLVYTKCYTTTNAYTAETQDVYADKETIVSNISALDSWSADNEKAPINGGLPVLTWENTWESTWDGTSVDTTWAGSGTEADPYLITSAAELAGLASKIYNATAADATSETPSAPVRATNAVTPTAIFDAYTGVYFKLTKDINLNNKEWLPIGRMGMRFNGEFDGGNHVISNLKISTPYYAMGLFGATSEDATISNLGLKKARVVFSNGTPADYDSTKAEPSKVAYNAINSNVVTRTLGAASLVGIFGKTEIINCFAKDVEVNNTNTGMNSYAIGGLLGGGWSVNNSGNNQRITATNCYITDVNVGGNASHKGLFVGTNSHDVDNNAHRLLYYFTNCYVGGEIVESDSVYEFGRSYGLNGSGLMSNCFTTATNCKANNFGFACYALTKTDKIGIEKALITGNNAWNLDSVENPTNGGYPILGWEKWWTTESDPLSSFKGAGVTVADGFVTDATVVQNDSAVSGTVVVAVYTGDRFKSAVTATAVNGVIDIEDMAVATGDTVKVFVWNSLDGVSPLALVYSTTVQ